MFMPFEYKGKPMCFYLADQSAAIQEGEIVKERMNSNCYAIHGFMVIAQREVSNNLPVQFFKNIYEGTLWWKKYYNILPNNTRICLESILGKNEIGKQLINYFDFEEALLIGDNVYNELYNNIQK